jgi:hypothetical protein
MEYLIEFKDVFMYMTKYCSNVEKYMLKLCCKKANKFITLNKITSEDIAFYGIRFNNTKIIDIAIDCGYKLRSKTAAYAANKNSIICLEYLWIKGCKMNESVCMAGAHNKNIFLWLKSMNVSHDHASHCMVISHGDTDTVKWLFETYPPVTNIDFGVCYINNLSTFKYLEKNKHIREIKNAHIINNLIENKCYDVIEYILDKNYYMRHDKRVMAFFKHDIEDIKWYFKKYNNLLSTDDQIKLLLDSQNICVILIAICKDKNQDRALEKLKWIMGLCTDKIFFTGILIHSIPENILLWLLENNYVNDIESYFLAAIEKKLQKVIEYFINNNYDGNKYIFEMACDSQNELVIKYLRKKNCNFDNNTVNTAIYWGNMNLIRWFKKKGHVFNQANLLYAIESNNSNTIECINYIYDNMKTRNIILPIKCSVNYCGIEMLENLAEKFGYDIIYDIKNSKSLQAIEWQLCHNPFKSLISFKHIYFDNNTDRLKIFSKYGCEYEKDIMRDLKQFANYDYYKFLYDEGLRNTSTESVLNVKEESIINFSVDTNIIIRENEEYGCIHNVHCHGKKCIIRAIRKIEQLEQLEKS